jgi:hypothetical protein
MKRTQLLGRSIAFALLVTLGLLGTLEAGAVPGFPQVYSIDLEVDGHGSVTVAPAPPKGEAGSEATYTADDSFIYDGDPNGEGIAVLCTAEADAGWRFAYWELGRVGAEAQTTDNPANLMLAPGGGSPSFWTLHAVFLRLYTIGVSADPTEGGTATGGGTYVDGAPVTVVATPRDCYDFANWTEDGTEVSTDATYRFTASADRDLVAHFQLRTYTITATADPVAGGTAVVNGGATHNCGSTVSVVATAAEGYGFLNWTEGGTEVSTDATHEFAASADRNLVAHFQLHTYTITTTPAPVAGGTATGGGTYAHGAAVSAIATPADCYDFVNWTEGGTEVSTNQTYDFAAEADRDLVAHFQLRAYTITTSADPDAGGTAVVNGGATHNCGSQVTVVATAADCYAFVNWTEGGVQVSTSATYSFTASENRNLVAHFQLRTYTITASADPVAGGTATVNGGATHNCGSEVTAVAAASGGYEFVNWTQGGAEVSASATYTFTAKADRDLVAHFRQLPPELFFDDVESGTNGWRGSSWYLLQDSCCPNMPSPTHDWSFGKNSAVKFPRTGKLTSPVINVTGETNVEVSFWYALKRDTAKTYVRAKLEYLAGRKWLTLWTLPTDPTGVWTQVGPLQVTIGPKVTKLQLRFSVTGASGKGCFTVDDVAVVSAAGARPAAAEVVDEAAPADEFVVESVENVPNPVRDVHTTQFTVKGIGIEEICVNIYDQSGLLVFTSGWQPNGYDWHIESSDGQTLANGVYLYTVLVRGVTGEIILTEVQKLAVYR